MAKEEFVRNQDGEVTHVRQTSDDGRTSWLYEFDGSVTGMLFDGGKGECIETTEHHPDGTTDAYEHDGSVIGQLFFCGKGEHK